VPTITREIFPAVYERSRGFPQQLKNDNPCPSSKKNVRRKIYRTTRLVSLVIEPYLNPYQIYRANPPRKDLQAHGQQLAGLE